MRWHTQHQMVTWWSNFVLGINFYQYLYFNTRRRSNHSSNTRDQVHHLSFHRTHLHHPCSFCWKSIISTFLDATCEDCCARVAGLGCLELVGIFTAVTDLAEVWERAWVPSVAKAHQDLLAGHLLEAVHSNGQPSNHLSPCLLELKDFQHTFFLSKYAWKCLVSLWILEVFFYFLSFSCRVCQCLLAIILFTVNMHILGNNAWLCVFWLQPFLPFLHLSVPFT